MSRRRQRQEEKESFLEQNPQLIKHEARIEVGRLEGLNKQHIEECEEEDEAEGPYVAEASLNGEHLPSFTALIETGPDKSLAAFVDTPVGSLSAGPTIGVVTKEVVPFHDVMPDVLSLSEKGFGVAQSPYLGEESFIVTLVEEDEEEGGNDFALDGDEIITFTANGGFYGLDVHKDARDFDTGATEFGIDYTILGGRGTVEIVLIGEGEDEITFVEGSSELAYGRRSVGDEKSLELAMDNGETFDLAMIRVTGTLEVAITGVDITSNDGFFLIPA
jgi:hypothetical protein